MYSHVSILRFGENGGTKKVGFLSYKVVIVFGIEECNVTVLVVGAFIIFITIDFMLSWFFSLKINTESNKFSFQKHLNLEFQLCEAKVWNESKSSNVWFSTFFFLLFLLCFC